MSWLKPKQVQAVEQAAQAFLDTRAKFPTSTLAQMYDPYPMPAELRTAHNQLDRTVEALYAIKAGSTVAQRLDVLLNGYQALAPSLALGSKSKVTRKKRANP